ncbi:gamma-glutamylcyclotransferase family protein [Novosphingobium pentaromativorans]|nr:gamma-glutamylcyclotransferase family protein [Novosphingobium pentaromativorans]
MTRLRLFVYGTLQPRAGTRMGAWIAARCQTSADASLPGQIHAIRSGNGWFPALVPAASAHRVRGTLCELELAPGELSLLDRYEGAEYRRAAMPVLIGKGGRVAAQVYTLADTAARSCPPDSRRRLPRVVGGKPVECLHHAAQRGLNAARRRLRACLAAIFPLRARPSIDTVESPRRGFGVLVWP